MSRSFFAVLLVVVLSGGQAILADDPPDDARGFAADRVYDVHDLDAINTFNGNLTIGIPIGPNHIGSVPFQLRLYYNTHLWGYTLNELPSGGAQWEAYPLADSNPGFANLAPPSPGLGWNLALPALGYNSTKPAADFTNGDGAYHGFNLSQPLPAYTNDGSALRLTVNQGTNTAQVEGPDGLVYTFYADGHSPTQLTYIGDHFGNVIHVAMTPSSLTLTNGQSQVVIAFKTVNRYPVTVIDTVTFTTTAGSSTYTFHGRDNIAVPYPWGDTSQAALNGDTYKVYLLDSLDLPAAPAVASFSMTYDTTTRQSSAVITKLTLPTGGSIGWTYDLIEELQSNAETPRSNLDAAPSLQRPLIVTTRTEYDGSVLLGTWHYHRRRSPIEFCNYSQEQGGCPGYQGSCGGQRQLTSWVTRPATHPASPSDDVVSEVSYFSTYDSTYDFCPAPGRFLNEYGKPFTSYASSTNDKDGLAAPTTYLSTERRSGVDDAAMASLVTGWNGQGSMSNAPSGAGTLHKSEYVLYEPRPFINAQPQPGYDPLWLRDSATFFDDDNGCAGTCFSAERQFGWDGFGHYRQLSTTGNFPGDNFRTTYTAFSPQTGVAWLPDFYDDRCSVRDSTVRTAAVSGCSQLPGAQLTRSHFSTTTGALIDRRVFKNTDYTLSNADLLQHYDLESHGYVSSERYYGGDLQPVSTVDPFLLPATPEYEIDHVYSFFNNDSADSLQTRESRIVTPGNPGAIVGKTTTTYDPYSGLVTAHTDATGLQTTYGYDARWRLKSIVPTGTGETDYTYTDASSSGPAQASLKRTLDSGNFVQHSYTYDAFGRLTRDESRTQTGGASYVQTGYDVLGRKTSVSSMVDTSVSSPPATTFSYFDAFDSPRTVTSADASIVSVIHTGARQVARTVQGIAGPSGSLTATTTETYDRFGRLVSVTEPSGQTSSSSPVGAADTATYGYDVADHLVSVTSGGDGVTQSRGFAYDARGFLLSEWHPELGQSGNGSTSYAGGYDSRGHATRKITGTAQDGFDLKFTFDKAGRLIAVEDQGTTSPRILKTFIYGAFGAANQGRLLTAIRHNRLAAGNDVIVSEFYDYDAAGRVKSRGTSVGHNDGTTTTPMQSFTQAFVYDNIDELTELDYPVPGAGPPASTITNTFSNGFLQQVATSPSSPVQKTYGILTYNSNGTVGSVTHGTNGGLEVKDVYAEDSHALPRPASIEFQGWQDCPVPVLAAPSSVCVSSTGNTATVSATGATGYTWTLSAGSITSGPGTSQITFTAPPSGPFTISVAVNGACPASASRTVTVSSGPAATVSGSTTVAPGDSATLRADLTGTAPWTVTWSDAVQSSVTSTPATRSVNPVTTTTYTVTSLTDSSSCPNGSASGSAVVTVAPPAPASITAGAQLDPAGGPAAFRLVFISWPAVSGAASYSVERAVSIHANYTVVGAPTITSFTDSPPGVSSLPNTYIYRVWAVSSAGVRSRTASPITFATVGSPLFSDEPIYGSVTWIRGIHIGELRRAIDEVRRAAEVPPTWSSYGALTGGIYATDVMSLRTALDLACRQIRSMDCSYAGSVPAQNGWIQAIHVQSVRDAVK